MRAIIAATRCSPVALSVSFTLSVSISFALSLALSLALSFTLSLTLTLTFPIALISVALVPTRWRTMCSAAVIVRRARTRATV